MGRTEHEKSKGQHGLPVVHRCAAGIDVGSTFHVVAVPASMDPKPVRTFKSFTGDLHNLADWLVGVGITTVAMESTGIYWVPIFEILEARGLEVLLVNARNVRNVPGRKTDVNDAQWLQRLHEHGLVRGSFRPRKNLAALRAYLRQRESLVRYSSSHVQHMQKALMQMNLQLQHVVSDITGVTGLAILRSIVAGERDPVVLAKHRNRRCKATSAEIVSALTGHYQEEHLFALQQAIELYDTYQLKIVACDAKIESMLKQLALFAEHDAKALPPKQRKMRVQRNEPRFNVRGALFAFLGTDLTQIDGFGPHAALALVGECGDDMKRWPTHKHFVSWLSLSPGSKISGGKILSSKTRASSNRAAAIFRMCAVSVGRSDTALGAFYRRLAARIGKAKAVTATARKLAILFYISLSKGIHYQDPGADHYEERYRQRVLRGLKKRAQTLGYTLVEAQLQVSAESVS
jgi:transposase